MTDAVPLAVSALLAHPDLEKTFTLRAGQAGLDRVVAHARVQKSGLVFAGHLRGMDPGRVQVVGETEATYLESLKPAGRRKNLAAYFAREPALTLVTRGVEPLADLLDLAALTGSPVVLAEERSSVAIQQLHAVLDRLLAPTTTLHGVCVEVHGVGILLLGPSGIGKSEAALFLVQRGHRVVADDRVVLTRLPSGAVVGAAEPLLRHHVEIRGLGILDIRDLYGATAVHDEHPVELVIELCPWRDDEIYDRLGLDDLRYTLLGAEIKMLRVPIRPGRDMATLLEVAARNELLKRMGRHGARAFVERLAEATGTPVDVKARG